MLDLSVLFLGAFLLLPISLLLVSDFRFVVLRPHDSSWPEALQEDLQENHEWRSRESSWTSPLLRDGFRGALERSIRVRRIHWDPGAGRFMLVL